MEQSRQNIQASILDRLIDHEPGVSQEPVRYSMLNIGHIKASLVRDLENLLNTRRQILVPPAEFREVNNSLFVYGLRDFTSENPGSPAMKQKLRQDVEKTIARFESRLKNVTVRLETSGKTSRNLKFRITGLLVMDPVIEPVSFDTYFDVNRGEYVISG